MSAEPHPILQVLTSEPDDFPGTKLGPNSLGADDPLEREEDDFEDYKVEKAWHRIVCIRTSHGDTPRQIAELVNKTTAQVRNVLKQPRSRKMIAEFTAELWNNTDGLQKLLEGGAEDAVMALRELSVRGKSEMVRMTAADKILDRVMGKAPAKLEVRRGPGDLEDEIRAQQKELEDLKRHEH